eukprot:2222138-Rhodomonas_salina.5
MGVLRCPHLPPLEAEVAGFVGGLGGFVALVMLLKLARISLSWAVTSGVMAPMSNSVFTSSMLRISSRGMGVNDTSTSALAHS